MYLKINYEWYSLHKINEFLPFPGIYVWMSPDREHDGPCSSPGWGTSLGSRPSTHCPGPHSATECLPAPDSDLQHTRKDLPVLMV